MKNTCKSLSMNWELKIFKNKIKIEGDSEGEIEGERFLIKIQILKKIKMKILCGCSNSTFPQELQTVSFKLIPILWINS